MRSELECCELPSAGASTLFEDDIVPQQGTSRALKHSLDFSGLNTMFSPRWKVSYYDCSFHIGPSQTPIDICLRFLATPTLTLAQMLTANFSPTSQIGVPSYLYRSGFPPVILKRSPGQLTLIVSTKACIGKKIPAWGTAFHRPLQ